MKITLADSLKNGHHYTLSLLTGNWKGMTKTWFEPDVLSDESSWEGTFRPILSGRFLLYEYKGSIQGKPLEGVAIFGYDLGKEKFQSAWVDSFHMSTGMMFSESDDAHPGLSVTGSYEARTPEEVQQWGWRTEIEIINKDRIIITACNITPDGVEAKGVETVYDRV